MSKYIAKGTDICKFKVDDGWLQIDKHVFEKMIDYVENADNTCLETFFEQSGYNPNRTSRIVQKESMATKMSEEMSIIVHTYSELFALNKYKEYYVIDYFGHVGILE